MCIVESATHSTLQGLLGSPIWPALARSRMPFGLPQIMANTGSFCGSGTPYGLGLTATFVVINTVSGHACRQDNNR